jgi:plastocyanin
MRRLLLLGFVCAMTLGMGPTTADVSGVTTAGEKLVSNAVVWLDAPSAPRRAGKSEIVLDQRNLNFLPHVLVVQVGTVVKFPNNDRVFHNAFSFHDGKKFDLGLYPVGTVRDVPFDREGLSRVFCNIHPQMAAYVMVVNTPYYAVSDRTGQFTIRDVPYGTYRYHAWRPGAAILNDTIVVAAGVSARVEWP